MKNGKLIVFFSLIFLAGCATTRKDSGLEMRSQVSQLQSELQQKDNQIIALQEALDKESKERAALATQLGTLSERYKHVSNQASLKQIQLALQNAGYDVGKIDGIMGGKTHQAIKDFQKANNLKVTGKVDKETWLVLRQYLHKKVK